MKKVIAAVLTGLFLVSAGAFAADKKCDKGYHLDKTKNPPVCVKDK